MSNRKVISGMHVIHEGLQNYPALRSGVKAAIERLQDDYDNTTSHLADIALHIGYNIKELEKLRAKIFAQHEHEKVHGV